MKQFVFKKKKTFGATDPNKFNDRETSLTKIFQTRQISNKILISLEHYLLHTSSIFTGRNLIT